MPRLATNWTVSDDGLTYTLQLAEGVKFHDGGDLTVEDVIWTFERLRSNLTADLYANVASVTASEASACVHPGDGQPDFLYNLTDNRRDPQGGSGGMGTNSTAPGRLCFGNTWPTARC